MNTMLEGVSLQSDNNNTTFCNIYTHDGNALTDMVLGGLASEDNLLEAVEHADFDDHASAEALRSDFENGKGGNVSFTYNDVKETLSYTPIDGTDWMLTYLIRESVISDHISSVSEGIYGAEPGTQRCTCCRRTGKQSKDILPVKHEPRDQNAHECYHRAQCHCP